jgi:hypothetical protein
MFDTNTPRTFTFKLALKQTPQELIALGKQMSHRNYRHSTAIKSVPTLNLALFEILYSGDTSGLTPQFYRGSKPDLYPLKMDLTVLEIKELKTRMSALADFPYKMHPHVSLGDYVLHALQQPGNPGYYGIQVNKIHEPTSAHEMLEQQKAALASYALYGPENPLMKDTPLDTQNVHV